jgi:hypothetical protein
MIFAHLVDLALLFSLLFNSFSSLSSLPLVIKTTSIHQLDNMHKITYQMWPKDLQLIFMLYVDVQDPAFAGARLASLASTTISIGP